MTADPGALYEQVTREFGAALSRLARAYEAGPEQQRDLLQEIHLALWRSLAIFEGQCSLRTWVYRVAHNTAFSHIARDRRRAGERTWGLDEALDMPDPHDSDEATDRERVLEKLYRLIATLHPLDRQIIVLYLEDEDALSIATITGLSPGNVATKIHRIKTLLAQRFHARETRDA